MQLDVGCSWMLFPPAPNDSVSFTHLVVYHSCWMLLCTAHQWNKWQSHMNMDRWWKLLIHPSLNKLQLWWVHHGVLFRIYHQDTYPIQCITLPNTLPNASPCKYMTMTFHCVL